MCLYYVVLFFLQTAIFGMVYIVGIGYGMIGSGIAIDFFMNYDIPSSVHIKFHKMIFSGGLISCTFWVSHALL